MHTIMIKGFGKCPYCTKRKSSAKVVLMVETGKRFKTLKEAADYLGKKDYKNIAYCCSGKTKTAYGYHWRYIDKDLKDIPNTFVQLKLFD